ncbi:OLC1v1033461C1 [Oldenlandia corymbosa var. corymbosa]|uniref:OLC1v1033461C1 n=1 Tax=Oldenlandia corymbosa var. corymbosa TaxID=529605 RepID=A0AAV1CP37_OLDCO|nr:OLC1v1033461C1 [Oldenlandia corymbosa var. corymbosa]
MKLGQLMSLGYYLSRRNGGREGVGRCDGAGVEESRRQGGISGGGIGGGGHRGGRRGGGGRHREAGDNGGTTADDWERLTGADGVVKEVVSQWS